MKRALLLLLGLSLTLGCEGDRELEIVHTLPNLPPGPEPVYEVTAGECLYVQQGARDHDLIPDWCVRLSPENGDLGLDRSPADDDDSDEERSEGEPEEHPPPDGVEEHPEPCGFINQIGSVGLHGSLDEPRVLYCDTDLDGGTRLARYVPETDELTLTMLVPGVCVPFDDSGALLEVDGGLLVAYVHFDPGVTPGHTRIRVLWLPDGAEDVVSEAIVELPGPAVRLFLHPLPAGPVLLAQLEDRSAWLVLLDEVGAPAAEPVELPAGIALFSSAVLAEGLLLAGCGEEDQLRLAAFDLDGSKRWSRQLEDSPCRTWPTPALATAPHGFAVHWPGEMDVGPPGVAFRDPDGEPVVRHELPADARRAAITWDGSSWRLVTLGQLWTWSEAGELEGTEGHPLFWTPEDSAAAHVEIRLQVVDDRLVSTLLGRDFLAWGIHVYSFSFLELGVVPLPD